MTRASPFTPGADVKVIDARAPGTLDGNLQRPCKVACPFREGELVRVARVSPLGMFIAVEGAPGMWRAIRFAPVNRKEL